MRKRIELFIDGQRADLDEKGLVLYNYAFTDAEKPTAVRNSYSKQVTLPGTPANGRIFSHCYRLDYRTTTGGFVALKETPFTIYSDTGEVIESGYLRLDGVKRSGRLVTGYEVSLFGGLGSFFYALSYRSDGVKKTLADLDYLGGLDPDSELDFVINATNVAAAWTRLSSDPASVAQKWDVVNFAPCYNGIPDGDFTPDKGYGSLTDLGLTEQAPYYKDSDGNTLVKLAEAVDEWAVKDLRSYLQRPVFSIAALLRACQRSSNNGGFTFNYSGVPKALYRNVWKTLPLIPSLGSFRATKGSTFVTFADRVTSGADICDVTPVTPLPTYGGTLVSGQALLALTWDGYSMSPGQLHNPSLGEISVVFVQLLSYSGATLVGASSVACIGPAAVTGIDMGQLARECGFTPAYDASLPMEYVGTTLIGGPGTSLQTSDLVELLLSGAKTPTRFVVSAKAYWVEGDFTDPDEAHIQGAYYQGGSLPVIWADGSGQELVLEETRTAYTNFKADYTINNGPRSGAMLGKGELLASKGTPADYLIGWAKLNGLVFLYDAGRKQVTLMERQAFFKDTIGTALDLTGRVDLLKEVTVKPLYASARWYAFQLAVAEGAFAKEYKNTYGLDYGIQRVDTNYPFDTSQKNLLEGSPFRSAVPVLAHGKNWNYLLDGGYFRPSPFQEKGLTYTLWNAGGKAQEYGVPTLNPATVVNYYNALVDGYDVDGVSRLQLCDASGKGVDGEDVLVWYCGRVGMPYFHLTDDSDGMLKANGGQPCWWLTGGLAAGIQVPTFSRYKQSGTIVTDAMDFGLPREVDIPGITFEDGCTAYLRRWAQYIRDLLDQDAKTLHCRVDLSGLQVGPELLRRFYWYDGALWVLNKITNYSLTTWDTVECELLRVGDPADYNGGQIN